ncbi:MAG: MBL fold metallo-hydrolase [Proteobacteria bacterium]|nr:MBL fold metallo-hydrolase [Pseudomonadota bacterium]
MAVEIKFCGAAGVVTGSSYLIRTSRGQFLIDCGLFQGTKTVRSLNYGDFGFAPQELGFVFLTHAHIDHSGLLPKLYKRGFAGRVYTTEATRDLLEFMLPDSAFIQETEVRQLNQRNAKRGLPEVVPIYTHEDAETCLAHIDIVKRDEWGGFPLGVKARFWNAGHILGSASIELKIPDDGGREVHILFSGDLGPDNKEFHPSPQSPHDLDYVVVESTYGSRQRQKTSIEDRRTRLCKEILEAGAARGNILIPAFAVERTQELLLDIDWLTEHNRIPALPLFIDSPLATKVTSIFEKYHSELQDLSGTSDPFKGCNIHYTQNVEESKSLNRIKSGAIIMAGSGMCDAGRIRFHLRNNLWNPACTRSIESYSAHADQGELVSWVKSRLPVRKNIFLVHGTDESRQGMSQTLIGEGVPAATILTPLIDESFRLDTDTGGAIQLEAGRPRITPEGMAATDWHNDYARFVLDLAEFLRGMTDSESRRALLADLTRHIGFGNRKHGSK